MRQGTNLETAHLSNLRLVIEQLRASPFLSRADLSRRLGLTSQTIGNLVDRLVSENLVAETGRRSASRGQPARELALNPGGACTLGIHLDRDRCVSVLCDLAGTILGRKDRSWPAGEESYRTLAGISADVGQLLAGRPPGSRYWGAGLACPGPLTPQGVLVRPTGFPGWDGVDLGKFLGQCAGELCWIENDARAAAVGELRFGLGDRFDHFLFVYFGGGLGLGIIQNRELVRGANGRAGEVAHTGGLPSDAPCGCGRRGCWETKASLTVLQGWLDGSGGVRPNPDELETMALGNDRRLREALAHQARNLAPLLESSSALVDVRVLVLGGRLGPVFNALFAGELGRVLPDLEVIPSQFSLAGALGAAALPGYPGS